MKLNITITDSIDYAKLLLTDFGQLLLLVILSIIPVVNLIVVGYMGNIIKQPIDSKQLPSLDNYAELWTQGLKIGIAAIIYMIIPLVLVLPFFDVWGVLSFMPDIRGSNALLMQLTGALAAFLIAIIGVIAIVNMIKHDNFSKAFAFSEVFERIKRIGWVDYIQWILVIFVCIAIISAIGRIFLIFWFIALLIAPIFGVFIARSASLIYSEGTTTQEASTIPT